jgi:hypothetical protein
LVARFAAPTSALIALACVGCGGGAPLLHPAHVLRPGFVSMGAGLSGELALGTPASSTSDPTQAQSLADLQDVAVSPGVAPWVAARVGIAGSNEAGLTYTGRSVRVDGRHAFTLAGPTLSIGIGGTLILPERPGSDPSTKSVTGGGADVPILLGWTSQSEIYSIWVGPRGGFEFLSGNVPALPEDMAEPEALDVDARHFFVGGVLGARVGFRHVHVAVELDGAYHHAEGTLGDIESSLDQATITPSGALLVTF